MVARVAPDSGGLGSQDDAGRQQTDQQVQEFIAGQVETIATVAGWARSVIAHRIWEFQTPEDIVQATLLALLQNLRDGRFQGGDLRAYVRRIAKNICITHYRRMRTRGDHISFEETGPAAGSGQDGDALERHALLDRILERLQASCRQIVMFAYVQGYSRKEIAECLGISEEAARVRLCRCLKRARALLSGLADGQVAQT
jgi:RNA polymerase sigma-70 factor (ECF subfamily)